MDASRNENRQQAPHKPPSPCTLLEIKERQAAKIRELGQALVASGFVTLDEQAWALGLPRSTAWTILRGNHKCSGLSASTINSMLAAPSLPGPVKTKILEYIEEKRAGRYGHTTFQQRKFYSRVLQRLATK